MPDYTGSVGAYALVGMGTAFAGIIRVPLTSVIMIFEITRDYSIIVPLMIANLISYFISSRLQEEPIYEALLHQDGIHLPHGAKAREALLTVGHAYRSAAPSLHADDSIDRAMESIDKREGAWPVVDSGGLRGILTLGQLEAAIQEHRGGEALDTLLPPAGAFPHVHPDHPLHVAIQRLAQTGLPALPVVSRDNVRELKGVISLDDITGMYRAGNPSAAPAEPDAKQAPAALLFGIAAVLAVLALVGAFLNYHFRTERFARAQQHFAEGNHLMSKDRFEEAIEQYRDALSTVRTASYREALAQALEDAGALQEAAVYYDEVLRERPDDGPANLGLARVDAALGQIDAALPHFQRAVYAQWPDRPRENRTAAHIAMVNALAKAGRADRARAEALALAADLPADAATRKVVANLLTTFDLHEQAANILREVVRQNPYDSQAQTQLGQALLSLNEIQAARAAFEDALKAESENHEAQQGESECERILALDPGVRGLRSAERYDRSRGLLKQIDASCVPPDVKQKLDAALASKPSPASLSDAAQDNQHLALEAWASRTPTCATAPDPALIKLMSLLAGR